VIVRETCPSCQGSGVRLVQTAALFGLMKKDVPTTCENCDGSGYIVETPVCQFCEGQGLVGNERDICRACNGTGRADAFSFVPRSKLKPGLVFERRCDQCGGTSFETVSQLENHRQYRSWETEAELRQVEIVERIKVRCMNCNESYYIPIAKDMHGELTSEMIGELENLGMNVSYLQ
jgi:DnaJ-class molecular chaperone